MAAGGRDEAACDACDREVFLTETAHYTLYSTKKTRPCSTWRGGACLTCQTLTRRLFVYRSHGRRLHRHHRGLAAHGSPLAGCGGRIRPASQRARQLRHAVAVEELALRIARARLAAAPTARDHRRGPRRGSARIGARQLHRQHLKAHDATVERRQTHQRAAAVEERGKRTSTPM